MRVLVRVGFVALWLIAFGCSSRGSNGRGPVANSDGGIEDSGTDASRTADVSFPDIPSVPETDECQKMDILFVVDDSGSMQEEQTNLAENFPRFVEVLDEYRTESGVELDYRIGVTTTGVDFERNIRLVGEVSFINTLAFGPLLGPGNVVMLGGEGPDGALSRECGIPRPWIERADGDVSRTFSCLAEVGTTGSGVEMPLKAMQLAVTERVTDGQNEGFLREDALLAVVILTDENDCSNSLDAVPEVEVAGDTDPISILMMGEQCNGLGAMPVSDVIRTIDAVKGDRGRWAVSVIAGPGPGACMSAFGEAQEAARLREFVDQVGENTSFSSVCDGDLTGGLMESIQTFDAACQNFPELI